MGECHGKASPVSKPSSSYPPSIGTQRTRRNTRRGSIPRRDARFRFTWTAWCRTLESVNSDLCPDDVDEVVDAFVMNRLTPEDRAGFEDHCIACSECRDPLRLAEELRDAEELESSIEAVLEGERRLRQSALHRAVRKRCGQFTAAGRWAMVGNTA